MLLFTGSVASFAQYNVDYKMAPYSDPQTIESNVDIGEEELITVGTITVTEDGDRHEDLILTRLDKEGKIVWNIKYGERDINERGNGVTLSWDKKHVIVVGSIAKDVDAEEEALIERYALVLKVRISDGAVIWNTLHGVQNQDNQAFLVKRTNSFEDLTYTVVGTSSGDPEQSFERMYAFKIRETGDEIWSRRYYLTSNFPYSSIRPMSMVENGIGEFLVAGTRSEVNRPTQIFTMGFRTFDGAVTADLFHYPMDEVFHVNTVDVDRHPEGKGYAVSFTANDLRGECVEANGLDPDTDRIGVMRLNEDRKVLWTNIYWENEATNHNGLSIRFYKDELHVCININRAVRYNTAGILRVKESNGGFIFCNTYHVPETLLDYGPIGNHMIRSNDDKWYYVKSIYADWGFAMTKADVSAKSVCDKETELKYCEIKTEPKEQKCEAKEYGRYLFRDIPIKKVDYGQDPCDERASSQPEEDGGVSIADLPVNKALVYPSPISEDQSFVNVKIISDRDETPGNIAVFNSMGQQVLFLDMVLINGENQFEIDAQAWSKGMYMLAITANGELVDRVKFVKN